MHFKGSWIIQVCSLSTSQMLIFGVLLCGCKNKRRKQEDYVGGSLGAGEVTEHIKMARV